jgi:hypothetical protein
MAQGKRRQQYCEQGASMTISVEQKILTVTPSQIAHAESYAEDKVADPEQRTFNTWWNSDDLTKNNRYRKDSAAYWAWEGWHAAKPEDQS